MLSQWSRKLSQRVYPGQDHTLRPRSFVLLSNASQLGYLVCLQSTPQCVVCLLMLTHPHSDITPFIPLLITLMSPLQLPPISEFNEDEFILASDALQEVLSRSALSDGAGTKALTEPLLVWCERYGGIIVEQTLQSESATTAHKPTTNYDTLQLAARMKFLTRGVNYSLPLGITQRNT